VYSNIKAHRLPLFWCVKFYCTLLYYSSASVV